MYTDLFFSQQGNTPSLPFTSLIYFDTIIARSHPPQGPPNNKYAKKNANFSIHRGRGEDFAKEKEGKRKKNKKNIWKGTN